MSDSPVTIPADTQCCSSVAVIIYHKERIEIVTAGRFCCFHASGAVLDKKSHANGVAVLYRKGF